MKNFLLITNEYKDANLNVTNKVKDYIEAHGGTCTCFLSTLENAAYAAPKPEDILPEMECVMVFGGDGTLIRAASALVSSKLPLIGVNLGTLGYLCELEEKNIFLALDRLLEGNFEIEERMMLSGYGMKGGKRVAVQTALNDIVIHRSGALSVVNLIVYVNGEYLNTFSGDGIIISTPTGSTGYNMSAGGPIVDPKAEMILLTPINAHNFNSRSIVISSEDEVMVEIGERRSQKDEIVKVSFDGDNAAKLEVGDRIYIHRAEDTTRICKLNRKSFLEILGKKMQSCK